MVCPQLQDDVKLGLVKMPEERRIMNVILSRETVLKGHAFNVEKVLLRLPDARERFYDLVDHADAVSILPIDEEGCVHFVRQFRVGAELELLELPAGVIDPGEEPDLSAHRELREETGCDCSELIKLGGFYMAAGYSNEYMHCYLALGLRPAALPQDEDEFLQLVKAPLAQALDWARTGRIPDSKSLAVFFLANETLKQRFPEAFAGRNEGL